MKIAAWPLVDRRRLVEAFRPAENSSREAPFRTVRRHHWASAGVDVVPRAGGKTAGRCVVFSNLNVDAVRFARQGNANAASAMAKLAEQVEAAGAFVKLQVLLSGCSSAVISALLEGVLPPGAPAGLWKAVRDVARMSERLRMNQQSALRSDSVAGCISEVHPNYVLLSPMEGPATAVPRWMASQVHRESVGDCMVLTTDRSAGPNMLVAASPAIDMDGEAPVARAFNQFDRAFPATRLTESDVRLLSGTPVPLTIRIPVQIET